VDAAEACCGPCCTATKLGFWRLGFLLFEACFDEGSDSGAAGWDAVLISIVLDFGDEGWAHFEDDADGFWGGHGVSIVLSAR